jgi:hypothetical protein
MSEGIAERQRDVAVWASFLAQEDRPMEQLSLFLGHPLFDALDDELEFLLGEVGVHG